METKNGKAKIYNVIILDKSGSMTSIARQAIDGVNETLGTIRSNQLRDPRQDNMVTVVAFCGCEMRTICDNKPIADVVDITAQDYKPCCMTPLYDAIGTTVTRLRKATENEECAVAVTIITDGYENASHEFSGATVKKLIDEQRKHGWMFAYIGADHDVEAVAADLNIGNVMKFDKSEAGTTRMFKDHNFAITEWAVKASEALCMDLTLGEKEKLLSESSDSFFDEEKNPND